MVEERKRYVAEIIWFSDKRGYGYCKPDDETVNGGADVFCHWRNIINQEGFKTLHKGDKISFIAGANEAGYQAEQIILEEPAPKEVLKEDANETAKQEQS